MEQKYINDRSLKEWLSAMYNDGAHIYAPVVKGERAGFKRIKTIDEIAVGHIITTQSAKAIAFPRVEKLFSYVSRKGDVSLRDYDPSALRATVVFGLHPCDAAGFTALSAIFNGGTTDKPFSERMKHLTLISLSCSECDDYCFCTSVNGGPGNTEGSDVLLTKTDNGYIAEIITGKGEALVDKYGSLFETCPEVKKEDFLARPATRFSLEKVRQVISSIFENDVWNKQSERCIGCGACAFVCPACACFDIQEDAKGSQGNRLRCWDSCGFAMFTLHASGHNPRDRQSARWRQRLLHKFAYMPDRLSVQGCTGCGRCSRACPADMNIYEHLKTISLIDK